MYRLETSIATKIVLVGLCLFYKIDEISCILVVGLLFLWDLHVCFCEHYGVKMPLVSFFDPQTYFCGSELRHLGVVEHLA